MGAVVLNNIEKYYGKKKILNKISLVINSGDMVALIGESGSGKTTLLNIIGMIESFDKGELSLFDDKSPKPNTIKAGKIIRNKIAFLFQNYALISNESVYNNMIMALKYVKLDNRSKKKLIADSLKEVGLIGYENVPVFTLSGGEQQRVALARILVNPKPLILADEPTGSLDPANRDIIMSHLKRLNEKGATVVIVTHDQYVANQCVRVVNIKKGIEER